jgi:hypothetical protein
LIVIPIKKILLGLRAIIKEEEKRFVPISRTVRRTHRRPVLTISQLASLTTIFVSLLL